MDLPSSASTRSSSPHCLPQQRSEETQKRPPGAIRPFFAFYCLEPKPRGIRLPEIQKFLTERAQVSRPVCISEILIIKN